MNSRILGIDISDAGTVLAYYGEETIWSFPTILCKQKDGEDWYIGEAAYEKVLNGSGIITDKLLTLLAKDGYTTLGKTKYEAVDLMQVFLRLTIFQSLQDSGDEKPAIIMVSIPEINTAIVRGIRTALNNLGYAEDNIHILSRSEAFIYYMMSQPQDIRNNTVGMFSLEDNDLTYYEMKAVRKAKSLLVFAEKQKMDESFDLEILDSAAGRKLADKILLSCGERLLRNKVFSAIILTGKGFRSINWATNFMKFLSVRRKVFLDEEVFARGAGFRGADLVSPKPIFSFVPVCDGRLECSVFTDINKRDRIVSYPLINAGDIWYDRPRSILLIPRETDQLELNIIPSDTHIRKNVHLSLDFLPKRPDRCTVMEVLLSFSDERHMTITLKDRGFGELFPGTDACYTEEVTLWD